MKKIVALAAALFATSTFATVDGTPHDLSSGSIGVCQYCHMPHNSLATTTGVPLWARTLRTNADYTLYSSSRITGVNLEATSYSLLCMSCHDGVVGLGTLHNGQTLATDAALDANTNLGTNLSNDHPVGLAYPASGTAATESGLVTLATATGAGYVFFGASSFIECGSCHDPHIWAASGANAKFKRTVTATDFCAGCHGTK